MGHGGAQVIDLEEAIADRRPRRVIGELCVRDGKVIADLPRVLSPDEARAWSAHLKMLADSAEADAIDFAKGLCRG